MVTVPAVQMAVSADPAVFLALLLAVLVALLVVAVAVSLVGRAGFRVVKVLRTAAGSPVVPVVPVDSPVVPVGSVLGVTAYRLGETRGRLNLRFPTRCW